MIPDPYPMDMAFGGNEIGSIGNYHYFKMNLLAGSTLTTSVQNTEPPAYTQTVQYGSSGAAYGYGNWFGGPATMFTDELVANCSWAIVDLVRMNYVDGNFAVNDKQNFAIGVEKNMRLQYVGGGTGSYTMRVYRKDDLSVVGNATFTIYGT